MPDHLPNYDSISKRLPGWIKKKISDRLIKLFRDIHAFL